MPTECGTGLGNFPQPGDPSNASGLLATATFNGVTLSWNHSTTLGHAVAQVYVFRSTDPDPLTMARIAVVQGDSYFDNRDGISAATTYYYWIQVVSVNGTLLELIGPSSAVALPSIEQMLFLLSNQINASTLGVELTTEIARIATLANDLTTEVGNRTAAQIATGTSLGQLTTNIDGVGTLLQEEANARVYGDSAAVAALNSYAVTTDFNIAAMQQEISLISTTGYTQAEWTTTLETVLGEDVATVQQRLESVNGLSASYVVKVDVTDSDYVSGFGLYSELGEGSQFLIRADTFAVGSPGATGPDINPFIIENNNVWMDSAYIQSLEVAKITGLNAGFLTAEIGNLYATSAEITNLDVDNIDGDVNYLDQISSITNTSVQSSYMGVGFEKMARIDIPVFSGNRERYPMIFSSHSIECTSVQDALIGVGLFKVRSGTPTVITNWDPGAAWGNPTIVWGSTTSSPIAIYDSQQAVGVNVDGEENFLASRIVEGTYVNNSAYKFYGKLRNNMSVSFGTFNTVSYFGAFEWVYYTGVNRPNELVNVNVYTNSNSPLERAAVGTFLTRVGPDTKATVSSYLLTLPKTAGGDTYEVALSTDTAGITQQQIDVQILAMRGEQ